MVFDPEKNLAADRLTAYLTVDLTSAQLDRIHHLFAMGSSDCPVPNTELFIRNLPEHHSLNHSEIRKAIPGEEAIIVINDKTPKDGGVWYLSHFADEKNVEDGEAESTNVLWKIRIHLRDVALAHSNYVIGNISVRENLDEVGVVYPTPEFFRQTRLYKTDTEDEAEDEVGRSGPTWVTVEPGEYEETTAEEHLRNFVPRQEKLYRVKPEIARQHGYKTQYWFPAGGARDITLPSGGIKTFPVGSLTIQAEYDPALSPLCYHRPEGSL